MKITHKYYAIALVILFFSLLLCSCSAQGSEGNPKSTIVTPIDTSTPVLKTKTAISGTAFVSAMEKGGFEWRGEEIYGNGKYSDDEYKIKEIRDYTLCIADNSEIYSDVMAIQYFKCADSTGATNIFNELRTYGVSILNEESGNNYTKIELDKVDGWDYGVFCIVDNTIITIIADGEYKSMARQLMSEFGY